MNLTEYACLLHRNVAVIHCKAGKGLCNACLCTMTPNPHVVLCAGRTGVMICAYLLHCKMWTDTSVREKKTSSMRYGD